jgi:hypothetical protein
MLEGLAWECEAPKAAKPDIYQTLSSPWASVNGPVRWGESGNLWLHRDAIRVTRVLDVGCTLTTADLFGAVSAGFLIIEAHVLTSEAKPSY